MNDQPIKVTLKDEDGKAVTTVQVPAFLIAPEIVIWSDRAFRRMSRSVYKEVFAYSIPKD